MKGILSMTSRLPLRDSDYAGFFPCPTILAHILTCVPLLQPRAALAKHPLSLVMIRPIQKKKKKKKVIIEFCSVKV